MAGLLLLCFAIAVLGAILRGARRSPLFQLIGHGFEGWADRSRNEPDPWLR